MARRNSRLVLSCILGLVGSCFTSYAGVTAPHHPRLFVISIGIDVYPSEGDLPTIRYGEADAKAIAHAFREDSRFAFAQVVPIVLLGAEATVDGITLTMQMIARQVGTDDILVFYYGGMGSAQGTGGYIFGAADTVVKAGHPTEHPLRGSVLATLLQQIPASRQIVILDTMDSQRAADTIQASLNPTDSFDLSSVQRQVAIFATRGASFEAEPLGHGLLTSALLKGMGGAAAIDKTGLVTIESLQEYMTEELPLLSKQYAPREATVTEEFYTLSNLVGLRLTPTSEIRGYGLDLDEFHSREALDRLGFKGDGRGPRDEYLDADNLLQSLAAAGMNMGPKLNSTDTAMAANHSGKDADKSMNLAIHSGGGTETAPTRALTPDKPDERNVKDLGHDYALIVGTDHYAEGWKELNNAVRDAAALRKELIQDYGFDPSRIREIDDATRSKVIATIKEMRNQQFGPNDRLLVYFAGHGLRNFAEGYLAFADSKVPVDIDEPDTLLPFSTLRNALNAIPAPHILLILDVCYGGAFDATTRFKTMLGNTDLGSDRNTIIRRALEAKSRIYLTSGDENHAVSDGPPGEHSPFSRALLAILARRGGANRLVDIATLYSTLRSLPILEPRAGYFDHDQDGTNADFLLIPSETKPGTP